MKWRQVDDNYAVSDCGFYIVSKCRGIHGEPVYAAWYRIGAQPSSLSGKAPEHLGATNMFKTAADVCGFHQQQQKARPHAA